MTARAFFGPPQGHPVAGGLQVSVYLVPVFEGQLVVFDVASPAAKGRWLPWAVIDYAQNPYEAASLLADDWLAVSLDDLALADVLSLEAAGGGWELAIIFRATMATLPAGNDERRPFAFAAGSYDAIAAFDLVDLQRWVESASGHGARAPLAAAENPAAAKRDLLF
jgi:hypothetical protein